MTRRYMNRRDRLALALVATFVWTTFVGTCATGVAGGELLVGAASVSITPEQPVALSGQRNTRVARQVENPVTATALAIEFTDGGRVEDQAIMVSCDLVAIRDGVQDQFRKHVQASLPGFDIDKLFLSATHTHTAPVLREGVYVITGEDVIQPDQYVQLLMQRLGDAVVRAWNSRRPAGVGWGLGHALVAHNRRAVYADGTARMYGQTGEPSFRGIEGYEDHYVDVLFLFDEDRQVTTAVVNVACPSQEVEGRQAVNADFWHHVRCLLRERFGQQLHVLAWTGASGDQSPHLMWYERAEERMRSLRGLTRLEEIARRIDLAVAEAYEGASQDIRFGAPLIHRVQQIPLPVRMVTPEEFATSKAFCDAVAKQPSPDPSQCLERMWNLQTVERYQRQQSQTRYMMELHAIRLGDVAICTNPFELYTEYGVRIRARSPAVQTLVVQLACASGGYLPTRKALQGGHYSTEIYSNQVGPEGGDVLVDQTVKALRALWDDPSGPAAR